MRICAGLFLSAVRAIQRMGISTVSTHGIAIHPIGDILMLVGILGVVHWMVVWAPWSRGRRTAYRREVPVAREERVYREDPAYRCEPAYRQERVYREDVPADEIRYEDEYRR